METTLFWGEAGGGGGGGGGGDRWYFTFDGAECTKPAVVYVLRPKTTTIVTAILNATVTRFLKVMYVWNFGLANVRVVINLEMVTLVGVPCLVL
jgi:hypothetical protein